MAGHRVLRMSTAILGALLIGIGAAEAGPITVDGSYVISQTGSAIITDDLTNPFSLSLDVGVPTSPVDFFNEFETSAANNTITATFTFTLPSAGNGSNSSPEIFTVTGRARHDSLIWNSAGQITVNFTDGAILDITLSDETFNGVATAYKGLTPTIIFDLVQGPTSGSDPPTGVPEPSSVALLSVSLLGFWIFRSALVTEPFRR
jgi:hypothetical protein